ncbi:Tn3 family transposase [Streptomyces sp. NPDC017254]|uniref:Tn3 family transposase n=1 Tax=unclassified Streptomyces TaxID=2593676 RepID=UPI0037A8184A
MSAPPRVGPQRPAAGPGEPAALHAALDAHPCDGQAEVLPRSGQQSALVHVDTLLIQEVPTDPKWADKLTDADRRALSPLFWTHVNPYGRFELDMNSRLKLAAAAATARLPGPRSTPGAPTAPPASGWAGRA